MIAVALPLLGVAALFLSGLAAVMAGRPRFLIPGISALLVAVVATIGPRLPQGSPRPVDPIRIASANVYSANPIPERAAASVATVDADLLVTVEMGDGFWRDLGARTSDRLPYHESRGELGLRSRWPLLMLPTPAGLDPHRVMRVQVARDPQELIVCVVHAFNPLHDTTFADQRAFVQRLLAAVDDESSPTIVVGDLNMSDRTVPYRIMDGAMRDAMRARAWGRTTFDPGWWRLLLLRIDHLFVPPDWCASNAALFDVPGSDHNGVSAEVGSCE